MINDYDILILYHLDKYNVVADALIQAYIRIKSLALM